MVLVMVMQVSLAARAGALASVHSFGTSFPTKVTHSQIRFVHFTNTICPGYSVPASRPLPVRGAAPFFPDHQCSEASLELQGAEAAARQLIEDSVLAGAVETPAPPPELLLPVKEPGPLTEDSKKLPGSP